MKGMNGLNEINRPTHIPSALNKYVRQNIKSMMQGEFNRYVAGFQDLLMVSSPLAGRFQRHIARKENTSSSRPLTGDYAFPAVHGGCESNHHPQIVMNSVEQIFCYFTVLCSRPSIPVMPSVPGLPPTGFTVSSQVPREAFQYIGPCPSSWSCAL